MTTLALFPSPFMALPRAYSLDYERTPIRERVGVVMLVVVAHIALGLAWLVQPEQPAIVVNEMSVSIAMQQAPVAEPPPEPPKPQPKVERSERPAPKPVVREVAEAAPPPPMPVAPPQAPPPVAAAPTVAAAPVIDTEADYKARYLNNPRPPYPSAARRMGWKGKVLLNVEVLAEGRCGTVNVFRSSGHEVLDNAAMAAVKTWRFTPATRAGRAVTQWARVPVDFSFEDDEA